MDLPDADLTFVRDLVKATRQRSQLVGWIDRDGTRRQTALTEAEAARLKRLAQGAGLAPAELLRRVAFVPLASAKKGGDQGPQTPPSLPG